MFADKTIAFIGSGIMGEAMIRGLLTKNSIAPDKIIASDPWQPRLEQLKAQYAIQTTKDNREAAEAGQIIVLSIKPQSVPLVLPEIRGHLRSRDLLLSIIAGVPIRKLADGAAHAAVVRSMPNTPAQIGQGITVWTATREVTDEHKEQAREILGSLGKEIFVDEEEYLDMATALSGSGPGYIFLFMEALIDAGVHMGFSRRVSEELVFQTIRGSVEYAAQSGKHVAELRNQVTSPGGTTAAALYHMEKGGLRTVISRGIWAAYQRSIELGRGKPDKGPEL
ncbi:MAG: pyrroline-5-carboxylate reductase [Chloroflexota bacterium]|nr:pyrroline-5-carboxylate reductase [Ardenticatenaceae bacterium]GIK55736.1 MAG: pyrroline-5-carboxylate reductase [Chloroflexota bacterium]